MHIKKQKIHYTVRQNGFYFGRCEKHSGLASGITRFQKRIELTIKKRISNHENIFLCVRLGFERVFSDTDKNRHCINILLLRIFFSHKNEQKFRYLWKYFLYMKNTRLFFFWSKISKSLKYFLSRWIRNSGNSNVLLLFLSSFHFQFHLTCLTVLFIPLHLQ